MFAVRAPRTPAGRRSIRRFAARLSVVLALVLAACSPGRASGPAPVSWDPFLDDLQSRTFRWFWDLSNPVNGLTPDRAPSPSFSSVAAVGFALTAYPIGAERGEITRQQAAERVLTTLRFLWNAPQSEARSGVTGHRGFFYHFLDMQTGHRFEQVELSTIDTALLMGGVLFCQEYFDGNSETEREIRRLADSLYYRVEWPWAQARPPRISMGWHPETGFIEHDWVGYDEAMLLFVLALGSPTHPVNRDAYDAYTSAHNWGTYYGQQHLGFAPMFGHQYSHVWIDFRGIRDDYMRGRGIDYFENSRRAAYAQRSYAIDNPMGWRDYSAEIWGLTASDGPKDTVMVVDGRERRFWSYTARGASFTEVRDDGTLVPTALGGSIVFAPEIIIPSLKAMRDRYGANLYSTYGFLDAFNPSLRSPMPLQHGRIVPGVGWFDTDYLGIDQGPIVAMIENLRSELVWRHMRGSPYVVRGLRRAGFTGGWLELAPAN